MLRKVLRLFFPRRIVDGIYRFFGAYHKPNEVRVKPYVSDVDVEDEKWSLKEIANKVRFKSDLNEEISEREEGDLS
jgi:hypothetical protein